MREIYYHQNPTDDTDECWGISYTAADAKYSPAYCCAHGDCGWVFYNENIHQPHLHKHKREIAEFVVGYIGNLDILTIRCPVCQRYLYIHSNLYASWNDFSDWVKDFKIRCPNWPK